MNKPSLSTCPTFSSSSETANCFFFFGFNFQYMTMAAFRTALSKSVSDDNFFTSSSFSEVMPQENKKYITHLSHTHAEMTDLLTIYFSQFSLKLLKFQSHSDHLSKLLKCPSMSIAYQNVNTLLSFKLYFKDVQDMHYAMSHFNFWSTADQAKGSADMHEWRAKASRTEWKFC